MVRGRGVILLLLPAAASAQPIPPNPSFACPDSSCWCTPPYAMGSVRVTKDITYGSAFNKYTKSVQQLLLDLYEPPVVAGAPPRPAALVIHGGGDRADHIHIYNKSYPTFVHQATEFAAAGYVAVSIEYRSERPPTEGPGEGNASIYLDPLHDARAAVRWLVAGAARLNIDVSRIAAFGGSAGAATTQNLCFVPGDGNSTDNPGLASNITAGVSLSGGLAMQVRGMVDAASAAPMLDIHGTNDKIAVYAGALNTTAWLNAHGIANWLISIPGAGHVPFPELEKEPYKTDLWGFLRQQMKLDDAACPPPPPPSPAPAPEKACKSWCDGNSKPWATKCTWVGCAACAQCDAPAGRSDEELYF